MKSSNPVIRADFPDPDVIRVNDTYYMVSTTMHFMPGCVILQSFDLLHWEVVTHIYDRLDQTPAQKLEGDQCIYGQGMWAASIRHHKGIFYVCFVANDTHRTYLYQSENICGPWKKQYIEGFYHDSSLLFDDDDRVYIAYGNTEIFLTELNPELTGPKQGGLHRIIIREKEQVSLGYEGAHLYKIGGRYYVFLIHWPTTGAGRRTEACFFSDSLDGEFTGKNILNDDLGYNNQGVAQGGIVDTPDGDWYAVLFQDRGAVGRFPIVVPLRWENNFPVLGAEGKVPKSFEIESTRPDYQYTPLYGSDQFDYTKDKNGEIRLKDFWQWNHTPDERLWSVTQRPGYYRIQSGKLSNNVVQAVNTLTQRMWFPGCSASVTVDATALLDGDYAGICALQGCYGLIAVTREAGKYALVMLAKEAGDTDLPPKRGDNEPGREFARIPLTNPIVTLKICANFLGQADEAEFYYQTDHNWTKLGITHKLYFKLDHFVGCRFGLFLYATNKTGGKADFSDFQYQAHLDDA
jgi:beta-xylosidase